MPAFVCRLANSAFTIFVTTMLAMGLTADAVAQTDVLYGLNHNGQVTVNASILDSLKGSSWVDLVVDGSDRYVLRDDGRVDKNGLEEYKIKCKDGEGDDLDAGLWVGLVEKEGDIWALSAKGYLAKNGVCNFKLNQGDFFFTKLFVGETSGTVNTWALRSDGALFENGTAGQKFQLVGGPGLIPPGSPKGTSAPVDGQASDTMWMSGAVSSDGRVYAMRRDGKVFDCQFLATPTPWPGELIADLPFGSSSNSATLYADFAFTADDKWWALRGSGKVYNQDNTLNASIEFNGNSSGKQIFVELLPLPVIPGTSTDTSFFALRKDGKLFRETQVSAVVELPKSGYGALALSSEAPDLTNHKNALPVVTKYDVQAVTGTAFSVPILATDTDKPLSELTFTVDESLPPFTEGATYNSMTRTISWDLPIKGKYKIKIEVDDGVGKIVKKTFKIVVRDPPVNPAKQVKPRAAKIKGTQALVGVELVLPLQISDQNGDALTVTVDDTVPPFTYGATFDSGTNTFTWTDSELSHIGSYTIQFNISDGIATVKRKVKIKLVSSLYIF